MVCFPPPLPHSLIPIGCPWFSLLSTLTPTNTILFTPLCPDSSFHGSWKLCNVPPKSANRSVIYDYGVKLISTDHGDDKAKTRWMCMATEDCREEGTSIAVSELATTNATNHLRDRHNCVGKRSSVAANVKKDLADKVCMAAW